MERKKRGDRSGEREGGVRERERERRGEYENREGKVPEKQMCQNCMLTMNVNSLCVVL